MSVKNDILDNLIDALQGITLNNGYNTDVRTVSRFTKASDLDNEKAPAIHFYETGERVNIEAETEIQYTITGYIVGLVKATNDLEDKTVALAADIRKLIYSPPSLGTYALDIQITESDIILTETEHMGEVDITIEIIYYEAKGNTAATLTAPYGTNDAIIDGKTRLYDQLTAAKAAISGSYTPDFDYLYDRHQKASMRLNAVSIDFEGSTQETIGNYGTSPIRQNILIYSIRAHTQYRGRHNDNEVNARLLESISNWLNAHLNLGDGYRIAEIGGFETEIEFAESNTIGGQLNVTLKITHEYAQA
jgi:subtilisin-like proprotein convertase family protein